MAGEEVVVVGAGMAGLTAALNLARDGKEVLILEKYDKVGGVPTAHPAVDATPMDVKELGRFIGVELGEPQVIQCCNWNIYAYGYKVPMDLTCMPLVFVERGHRKSALDMYLYDLCLEAGCQFEFNKHLVSQGDFAQLPPDTIISTGLHYEAFEALNVPYQSVFGYIGRGKSEKNGHIGVWFDEYILDYAYCAIANGAVFVLYFARQPVMESEFEEFKEKKLKGQEGITCTNWDYHQGLVPVKEFNNPRLFSGNKILAGTLGGMIEPFGLFGVHSSLVSGKIAALAHRDKAEAYALFKRFTRFYNRNFLFRKIFVNTPDAVHRRTMGPGIALTQRYSTFFKGRYRRLFRAMPGYDQLPD